MGDNLNTDFWHGVTKAYTWVVSIVLGVLGKISHDLLLKKKRSMLQWIGVTGVSIFVGYLCYHLCIIAGYQDKAGFFVPACTLFGEKIIWYCTTKWDAFMDLGVALFKRGK